MNDPQGLLEKAERAYAMDDLADARACYCEILRERPDHPVAARALAEIDRVLEEHFRPSTTIALAMSLRELASSETSAREALVISRLASGAMSVQRLGELSRLGAAELRPILYRYAARGVLAVR